MSNEANNGCAALFGFAVLMGILSATIKTCSRDSDRLVYATPIHSAEKKWFEGGTLHNVTVGEWRRASEANKLATCGDWISAHMNAGNTPKKYASMDEIKSDADWLRRELNDAVSGTGTGETDSMTEISVIIMVMMKIVKL